MSMYSDIQILGQPAGWSVPSRTIQRGSFFSQPVVRC